MSQRDRVINDADSAAELPQCVYSIHGIRTNASWQSRLASQITDATGFETFSRNYRRFDLFMFVFKGLFSGSAWRLVASDLRDLTKRYRVNVVAHSFGTWLLLEILKDDPDIKVNNVILCGAVFPRALAWWRKLKTQSAQIKGKVVNYCGRRDPFPALAEVLSRDYGASGVVGAAEPTVHDSFHDLGHSGFLTARFCEDFWIPFLKQGTLTRSDDNPKPLAYIEAILWIAAHRGMVLLAGIVALLGLYHLYQRTPSHAISALASSTFPVSKTIRTRRSSNT
jgi:pimeloyl-ACP methyl ester carboxylesterase